MQDHWDFLHAPFDWLPAPLHEAFGAPSRLSLAYLASFVAMAYAVYLFSKREHARDFWRFLAPRQIYLHRSHLTDIQLFVAGRFFAAWGVFNFAALTVMVSGGEMAVLSRFFDRAPTSTAGSWLDFLVVTLLVAVVADFCTYWVHRLHHEQRMLWPFHKVHHSAEVLTPVTAYRKHPVYDIASAAARALPIGAFQGLVLFFFVGQVEYVAIGGANVLYVLFNFCTSNLRHSHIWLDFGRVLDRIFISPAQHQIHHSQATWHFNKNYGEIFAVWDWMFGTLYIPRGREIIAVGLADEFGAAVPQPYPTFTSALVEPFRESIAALDIQRRAQTR
jgi:sterol desaturase/sphingolipid hydroxylase (fatty acid hydroxylase superfamily)